MVYSTWSPFSRTESAIMWPPFLSWIVSAHRAALTASQQIVMSTRNLKNCSNYAPFMKRAVYSLVTQLLLAAISVGVPGLCAQTAASAVSTTGQLVAIYRQLLNPAFDTAEVHRLRQIGRAGEYLRIGS